MSETYYNIPIGLFFFNRLDTLKEVLSVVKTIKPNKLYLVSDGPRNTKIGEDKTVESIRKYVLDFIDWDCSVYKNFSETNMGCKDRMASGISWIFKNEDKAIILEDDVVPSLDFFMFEKEMLNKYENEDKVMLVSGFKFINNYPIKDSYFFSNHPMIWGWGTWKRAWSKYDIDIKEWPEKKKNRSLRKYYNFFGYLVAKRDFDSVFFHKKDTWDFQWKFIVQSNNGLAVIPKVNLIENLGFGRDDATHTKETTKIDFSIGHLEWPYVHPKEVAVNKEYDRKYLMENWGLIPIAKKIINRFLKQVC